MILGEGTGIVIYTCLCYETSILLLSLLNFWLHFLFFRNTVQLIVNIADVNDNAPEFLQSEYEARLLEDSTEFESPLVIEARDLDLNGKTSCLFHFQIL